MIADRTTNKTTLIFLIVTFGFSWTLWGSKILQLNNSISIQPLHFFASYYTLGGWGPMIGAVFTAYMSGGLDYFRRFVSKTFNLSFSKKWLVPTLLLFPTLVGTPLLLVRTNYQFDFNPINFAIIFIVILLTTGPLQEEYGWRGILQLELEKKFTILKSSLITGIIWGIWHFPLFFIPGQGFYYDRPILGLLLSTTLISVLFGWIYHNTNKNLLLMLIFHTTWNYSHYIFPTIQSDSSGLVYFVLLISTVLLIIWKDRKIRIKVKPNLTWKMEYIPKEN